MTLCCLCSAGMLCCLLALLRGCSTAVGIPSIFQGKEGE